MANNLTVIFSETEGVNVTRLADAVYKVLGQNEQLFAELSFVLEDEIRALNSNFRNIDKVTDEIVNKYGIVAGHYDNVSKAEDSVPTHWDIGKVIQRIVLKLADSSDGDIIGALIKVYNSWIIAKIDDYNSSMYYENTSYQYESLLAGKAL